MNYWDYSAETLSEGGVRGFSVGGFTFDCSEEEAADYFCRISPLIIPESLKLNRIEDSCSRGLNI
jgi:hypothetical protein